MSTHTSQLFAPVEAKPATVRLGEVAKFVRGVTFKPADVTDDGSGVICLRTKNVQKELDLSDVIRIPPRLVRRDEQYVQHGDLVVSSANSWNMVGKAAWVIEPAEPMAVGGFISVLRANNQLDARYLYWWFTSDAIQRKVRSFGRQTTNISNLNFDRCLDVEVPFPALSEQRRIAAILDQADDLRTKRRSALSALVEASDGLFFHTFGSPARSKSDGLLEVCDARSGGTPSKQRKDYWGGGVPWFSPKDLKSPDLWDSIDHVTERAVSESTLSLLPADTVVLVVRGMILAHTFPVACLRVTSTINQDMKALIPRSEMNPQFLAHAIRAQAKAILTSVSAAGHGTKRLDTNALASIRIPHVPASVQHKFGERVSSLQSAQDKQRVHLAKLDELFASLQHRAFRGEL